MVVKVKNSSIESSRMKREIASQARSATASARLLSPARRTTEDHQRDNVGAPLREAQLHRGPPGERHHRNAGQREEHAHRLIRDVVGVHRAGGVVERAVEASERTGEADEHLAERGMHVEEEGPVQVESAELAKVGLETCVSGGSSAWEADGPRPRRPSQRVRSCTVA